MVQNVQKVFLYMHGTQITHLVSNGFLWICVGLLWERFQVSKKKYFKKILQIAHQGG